LWIDGINGRLENKGRKLRCGILSTRLVARFGR